MLTLVNCYNLSIEILDVLCKLKTFIDYSFIIIRKEKGTFHLKEIFNICSYCRLENFVTCKAFKMKCLNKKYKRPSEQTKSYKDNFVCLCR